MADAVIVRPQLGAVARVVGVDDAAAVGHEQQVAAGREQRRQRRLRVVDAPRHLAGERVARVDVPVGLAAHAGPSARSSRRC